MNRSRFCSWRALSISTRTNGGGVAREGHRYERNAMMGLAVRRTLDQRRNAAAFFHIKLRLEKVAAQPSCCQSDSGVLRVLRREGFSRRKA